MTPTFASVLDSLQDVSSVVFAALAFARPVPAAEGLRARMSAAEVVGLSIALALFAYLLIALLRPERF